MLLQVWVGVCVLVDCMRVSVREWLSSGYVIWVWVCPGVSLSTCLCGFQGVCVSFLELVCVSTSGGSVVSVGGGKCAGVNRLTVFRNSGAFWGWLSESPEQKLRRH